jgi:hypothetical protein
MVDQHNIFASKCSIFGDKTFYQLDLVMQESMTENLRLSGHIGQTLTSIASHEQTASLSSDIRHAKSRSFMVPIDDRVALTISGTKNLSSFHGPSQILITLTDANKDLLKFRQFTSRALPT